jgi:hypothetical protein
MSRSALYEQDFQAWANEQAGLLAVGETFLPKSTFPAVCPWTFEQMMDEEFWP